MNRENVRNGVQRNLFGTSPSDHNKSQENMMREASRISKEKSELWNFDFENFEPLPPGRYKWERVGKRLQTRTSPTLQAESTSDSCTKTIESRQPGTKRHYNLRTREAQGAENMECFRAMEAEGCSKIKGMMSVVGTSSKVQNTDLVPAKKKRKHQRKAKRKRLAKLNPT